MPVTINNFTYTNGNSGRTRVNKQGLIVGVDFSLTSNTIGTGPRTFVLAADLGVNRDWPVGSTLVAVAQAGATGSLIGTVTSYVASTQTLVMEVGSVTGSGTGTNWRIGSTMVRELNGVYDFRTYNPMTMQPAGLFEDGATNLVINSEDQTGTGYSRNSITISPASGTFLNGNNTFHKVIYGNGILPGEATGSGLVPVFTQVAGTTYAVSFYAKAAEQTALRIRDNTLGGLAVVNLVTGAVSVTGASFIQLSATSVGIGVYRISWIFTSTSTSTGVGYSVRADVTGDGVSGFLVAGFQVEVGSAPSSYIPTTTVSVTRAADQLSVGGTNFSQFYNSAQGTLVMELTPIASAFGAVAGSLNDGTLNNAIRIQQKQSGTLSSIRKVATDGVTDVMVVSAATGNTLRANGVDYIETPDQSGVAKLGVASSGVGNFMSVGGLENFRNSADSGLTYNARTIGGTFAGAHFGIGRFVIGGSTSTINGATVGSVIVSTDGLALRRVNIAGLTQQLNEVTSNGTNQYVAVGEGGVIYTSSDAESWVAQTSGTAQTLRGVHFFGGRYVAASDASGSSRYSDNGTNWIAVTGLNISAQDVHHNGTNLWVAVGLGGAIYSSPDGITWTARTSNVTAQLNSVFFADGLWVAVGNTGTVVTSPDGISWTNRTANSGTTQKLTSVKFFNGKFYYVGAGQVIGENTASNIVANVTWTARTSNVTATLNGIATNGTRLLICGSFGAISTSEDGVTFTSRTGNAATLNGAAFGAGTYVVVGNAINGSGLIATVDPTTFAYTRRVSGTTVNLSDVRFLSGAFYVCGSGSVVARSTDGITWNTQTIAGTAFNLEGVAANGSTIVAVGSTGSYSVSTGNGATWAARASTGVSGAALRDCEFANGIFVAVGDNGVIGTSPNGTTWTLRTSGTTVTLYAVCWNTRDQCFYAAGDGGVILRSADAITWTSISNDATVGIFTAGALQANPLAGKFIPNVKNRVAIGWTSTGGVSISINGGDVVTDPSVTMPVLTQYSVGMNGLSGQHWNSTIKTQRAYRVRVSDDELKALSRV